MFGVYGLGFIGFRGFGIQLRALSSGFSLWFRSLELGQHSPQGREANIPQKGKECSAKCSGQNTYHDITIQ